jgi:hypothetical protein
MSSTMLSLVGYYKDTAKCISREKREKKNQIIKTETSANFRVVPKVVNYIC